MPVRTKHAMKGKQGCVTFLTIIDSCVARKQAHQPLGRLRSTRVRQQVAGLRRVCHPNVVEYYACLEQHGRTHVYMEPWGESVRSLMGTGGHGAELVRPFLIDVLHGVQALHEHGMTHGDIKPANVVYQDGIHKLCDCDDPSTITANYMSPERGRAWPDTSFDRSSDVYSVGMSAVEVLTGLVPYEEFDSATLVFFQVCTGQMPRAVEATAGLDALAVSAITRLLVPAHDSVTDCLPRFRASLVQLFQTEACQSGPHLCATVEEE